MGELREQLERNDRIVRLARKLLVASYQRHEGFPSMTYSDALDTSLREVQAAFKLAETFDNLADARTRSIMYSTPNGSKDYVLLSRRQSR